MKKIKLSPRDIALINVAHHMAYMRSAKYDPAASWRKYNNILYDNDMFRDILRERFRLSPVKGGGLEGKVPGHAVPQLKGKEYMYKWMDPEQAIRTPEEAEAFMPEQDKQRIRKILSKAAAEKEQLTIDLKKGDIILAGRFKNRRMKVRKLDVDKWGQPTVNGRKLLSVRLEKYLPEYKKSVKTRMRENNKEAYMNGYKAWGGK